MQLSSGQMMGTSIGTLLIGITLFISVPLSSAQRNAGNCVNTSNDTQRIVCVCDEKFCDEFSFQWPQTPGQAFLVESTESGDRFKISSLNSSAPSDSTPSVTVRLEERRQVINGWGGGVTDAAALNINSLKPTVKEHLLQSYFGANGLGYNFARVPIAGTDFSTRKYSYDDADEPDYNLTQWALAPEDIEHKIPIVQRAIEIANARGETLKLFASPWSPPRWMKTNNDFIRGKLIDEDRIYKSYANYLINFYEAYRARGVEFWGATIQNEPVLANSPGYSINSLQLGINQTIKFISEYLGPALEASGRNKNNFKLMVGDDSLAYINEQVPEIMADERVRKYVSGLAFHWYMSNVITSYDALTDVIEPIRDDIEFVLMTEACSGYQPDTADVKFGSWKRGEDYAADIIEDLKRETGGWIDWNIALDEEGGPSWSKMFVDSPIIVDKNGGKFYKQPMYYTFAHFTRFFRPGSIYTEVETDGDDSLDSLGFAAAQTERSGHLIVNVLNKGDSAQEFSLIVEDSGATEHKIDAIHLQPKSMNSIVIKL